MKIGIYTFSLTKAFLLLFLTSSLFAMSSHHHLINIKNVNPTIKLEIVYATNNNFAKKAVYTSAKCFMHKDAAQALDAVQKELHQRNLGLKIWDGYRPKAAQWKFWNLLAKEYPNEKDRENYVSDPRKGGRHTRGTAVDLTLINLETGNELQMPTEFDHFGIEAWRDYQDLPEQVKNNRQLLEDVMEKHGFKGLPTEWWHFDFKGWEGCEPLDIPFEELD